MSKYFKAISANFVFLLANTLSFLILTPLAIRAMGEEFYGLWSVIYSIMLFSNIGSLGISSIVNKFVAESSEDNDKQHNSRIIFSAFLIIMPVSIITATILWSTSGFIAKNLEAAILNQNNVKLAIRICAIGIIPQFIAKIPQGYFLSQYKNNLVRLMDFAINVFPWIGAVIICSYQKNLIWIAEWFVILQIVILMIYISKIRGYIYWRERSNLVAIKKMTNFSLYMFLESVAIALFQLFDRVIVSFVLGPAIAGVYAVGTSVGLRLSIIAGQITEVMIPYASRKDARSEDADLFAIFRKLSRYVSVITAVLGSMLILWMHEILTIWISQDYAEKYFIAFCVFVLAYGILSLSRPGHQTLQGIGQVKFSSILYLLASITMLFAVYILSKQYQLLGAAFANAIMILLLGMNLKIYFRYQNRLVWKNVFIDLAYGMIFPIIAILIVILQMPNSIKISATILMGIWMTVYYFNDSFAKDQIRNLLRTIIKA